MEKLFVINLCDKILLRELTDFRIVIKFPGADFILLMVYRNQHDVLIPVFGSLKLPNKFE